MGRMKSNVHARRWLFWIIGVGVVIVRSDAGTKWQKQDDRKPERLLCYHCNSFYDTRCADPFDPYTIGYVDCNMIQPPGHLNRTIKPSLCRKTVQKVDGKVRVIRGCGYIPDKRNNKECLRRSGTHNVQVAYCECKQSFCNVADSLITNPSISFKLGTAILFLKFLYL